jgi:hypothetical protein
MMDLQNLYGKDNDDQNLFFSFAPWLTNDDLHHICQRYWDTILMPHASASYLWLESRITLSIAQSLFCAINEKYLASDRSFVYEGSFYQLTHCQPKVRFLSDEKFDLMIIDLMKCFAYYFRYVYCP